MLHLILKEIPRRFRKWQTKGRHFEFAVRWPWQESEQISFDRKRHSDNHYVSFKIIFRL